MGKIKDITGQRFNRLLVLQFDSRKKTQPYWLCKCDCGNEKIINGYSLLYGKTKSCGCLQIEISSKRIKLHQQNSINSHNYKGFKELSGRFWYQIKACAKKRKIEFEINIEYAYSILEQQDFKCILSGVDIRLEPYGRKRLINKDLHTASLDRIDSNKGYIEGNIQWIHKNLQLMKWDKEDEDFINWCHIISNYQREKNGKI